MKLYEAPKGTILNCYCPDGSTTLTFDRIDGMYGKCVTARGEPTDCYASCELIPREDGTYDIGKA
jgi:hypothetical protein